MPYHGQYYAVRKGQELRRDHSNVKFTRTRVPNGIEACKQTFGKVADDMFVKEVGPSRTVLMTQKCRLQIITDPYHWVSMEGTTEFVEEVA